MNSQLLLVEPTGGLCNRFRVIVSARLAAEKNHKALTVLWRNTSDCSCSAADLFTLPEDVKVVNLNNLIEQKAYNQIIKIKYKNKYNDNDTADWMTKGTTDNYLQSADPIYIRTCVALYGYDHPEIYDYSIIQPKADIMADAESFVNGKRMIGIHIRRTDNQISIDNSPLELFFAEMDKELAEHQSNCTFFIATDEDEIKQKMLSKYGEEHILTRAGIDLSRSSAQGIRDAYVDLLCLSKCEKIYGSYWSSYSECASMMGHIPLIICKK